MHVQLASGEAHYIGGSAYVLCDCCSQLLLLTLQSFDCLDWLCLSYLHMPDAASNRLGCVACYKVHASMCAETANVHMAAAQLTDGLCMHLKPLQRSVPMLMLAPMALSCQH